jgi:hypothetical protein
MGLFWHGRTTTTARRSSTAIRDFRTRLGVTRLEARDCPAAPTIPSFQARLVSGNWVVDGQVSDEHPGSCSVAIGGDVSGSAVVYDDGHFQFITPHTGTGQVTATATDDEGLTSMTSTTSVTNPPGNQTPVIQLEVKYNTQRSVTLFGKVIDDDSVSGVTVSFGGKVSGTATTDANGAFSFTQSATGLGTCTAGYTDPHGASATTPVIKLVSAAPVISGFVVTSMGAGVWAVTGTVIDESAYGETVKLSSGISQLDGQTVTVGSDGTFRLEVSLPSDSYGTVTAQVTDWWGLASNNASFTIV